MTKEQEEDLGFRVTDKRAFRAEATPPQESAPKEPEKAEKPEPFNVLEDTYGQSWPSSPKEEPKPEKAEKPEPSNTLEDSPAKEQPESWPATGIRIDIPTYVLSYYSQGLVLLGEVPHPHTNKNEEDLEGAQHMVDILAMLQEKTKGNLTKEENQLLDSVLYELRMRFMAKTKRIKL